MVFRQDGSCCIADPVELLEKVAHRAGSVKGGQVFSFWELWRIVVHSSRP